MSKPFLAIVQMLEQQRKHIAELEAKLAVVQVDVDRAWMLSNADEVRGML